MTNNDILRRIRYIFNISDLKMTDLFASAGLSVTRQRIFSWLEKEENSSFEEISDLSLAIFLNGFIHDRRGKKDGDQLPPEKCLTNNIILKKLKIALSLKTEDVLEILDLADMRMSKNEVSAFFRKPDHKHYRECRKQVLRNFLKGMQVKYRDRKKVL